MSQRSTFNLGFFRFILLFYALGLFLELILIDHYENVKQIIPLLMIPLASLALFLFYYFQGRLLRNLSLLTMAVCILAGILGIFFHFQGNFEFEKEMYPTMSWVNLFIKSMKGATPLLAPGSLIGFGLMGFLYLFSVKHN
jgi:hypothetical protein